MFGGVSLAVYINGVSQELFRAVRGRGVYRLLKALTDSDIVVDILSGASAGGINSVLLSAALCNQTDFGSTAELWRSEADIERLLSLSADDASGAKRAPPKDSVLDGNYHDRKLQAALDKLLSPPMKSVAQEDVSKLVELDLFITATDIDGQKRRWFDALGHPIELLDHRTLFRLKHRDGRNTPFARFATGDGLHTDPHVGTANLEALTKISHITSCFPGAFEPVRVVIPAAVAVGPHEKFSSTIDAVNARLGYWGWLSPFQDAQGQASAREALFMDGGVLKNKPFTSTIDAIFSRLADRQVSRFLLYVDPDPGNPSIRHPVHPDGGDPAARLLPVAIAAASGLPRFESIDADLAQVELHNQQVRRYEAVVKHATAAALASPTAAPSAETASARAYRRARLAGLAAAVVEPAASNHRSLPFNAPGERPARPDLSALIDRLCQSSQLSELFQQFDVLFGFRRLIQLSYTVNDHARVELSDQERVWATLPAPDAVQVEHFQIEGALLEAINHQIEFYEVVRARLETDLSPFVRKFEAAWGSESFWLELADRARSVLRRLPRPRCFAGTETGVAAGSVDTDELLVLRDSRHSVGELPPVEDEGLLRAAEAFEKRLLDQPNLRKLYDRFPQIDEVAYPLELLSELRSRDQIRTVRISTLDSTRGFANKFTKKLCGRKLGGFSGFFKATWRANDLMWGRIDGASQLLELLLDSERLAQLAPELLESNLKMVLGEAFDLRAVFPHSPDADRGLLEDWLRRLCKPGTAVSACQDLDRGPLLRETWARAVQLEIVVEELPVVLDFALADEAPAGEKAALVAQRAAFQSSSPLQVGASAAAYFTPEHYRIGEQSLPSGLPAARLGAIASEGGARLKDALLASLPDATFGQHLVRTIANGTLSAVLRLVTELWLRGKLERR